MMVIEASTGTAFVLKRGQKLTVIDPEGAQVADLVAFSAGDPREVISSGRTLDYLGKLCPTTGDYIYSNRSQPMLQIATDTVGSHDFLLTPCSADTFRLLYAAGSAPTRGCFENLADALAPFGLDSDSVPSSLNLFMNVKVDTNGILSVVPPKSQAGDHIELVALMDLIIGLTACSAPLSNGGYLKPIHYSIAG